MNKREREEARAIITKRPASNFDLGKCPALLVYALDHIDRCHELLRKVFVTAEWLNEGSEPTEQAWTEALAILEEK